MNFPVRLVPPGSESLRRHLGRTSEFFIKASGWDGASGGRGHARGTLALIKVPKQEGKCDKSTCASVYDREVATNSSSVTSPRWPGNMCRRPFVAWMTTLKHCYCCGNNWIISLFFLFISVCEVPA